MKEIKAIIKAYNELDRLTTRAALATVVRVEGSSYRRTGARMLVTDDGVWVGGISGGCLEGDALKRARAAIAGSEASLITYDTTEDDAYQIGVGLGCNGIIDVLFTPLDFEDKNNPVEVLKACVTGEREIYMLLTVTGLSVTGEKIKRGDAIPYTGAESLNVVEDELLREQLVQHAEQQIELGRSASLRLVTGNGVFLSVFIEILLPDIRLVLMGHQYDVYPLARLAREMDWPVTIVSNPLKTNLNLIKEVGNVVGYDKFNEIAIDRYTAIILMSHDYKTDKKNLPLALKTAAFYIGMLGPRVRSEKIFTELTLEGVLFSEADMNRIFAPAGLDIGAVTPEEISLSIIAEIKSVFASREGGFLRLRQQTIHERL